MSKKREFGAVVISLDFELVWGVWDFIAQNPSYRENILGERLAVPAILNIFREYDVAATWAVVGFIFAKSVQELEMHRPAKQPGYLDTNLDPFQGLTQLASEESNLCFAPGLIEQIRDTPNQELATHTFSHFYTLEKGQSADSFAADIQSAIAIANKMKIDFRSIIFPRNQHNPEYDGILRSFGITNYRGNQNSWMYQFDSKVQTNPIYRAARLTDAYINLSGRNTYDWRSVSNGKLMNIPASSFLRPVTRSNGLLQGLQFRRIANSLTAAAQKNQIFHLWWHPHNFGVHLNENIEFLRRILDHVRTLRDELGLRSLNMANVAEIANGDSAFR